MSHDHRNERAKSLLADVLAETRLSAEEESRRIKTLKRQRQQHNTRQRLSEAEERQARIDAQLKAEAARRQEAERRRTNMIRAIEGPSDEELEALRRAEEESLKRAQIQARLAEVEAARIEAEHRAAEAERLARQREAQRLQAIAQAPQPAPRTSRLALFVAAGAMAIVALLLVGGIGAAIMFQGQQSAQTHSYTKLTLQPALIESPDTLVGFAAENVEEALAAPEKDNCDWRCQQRKRNWLKKNNPSGKSGNSGKIDFGNLDGDDPLKSGKE